MARAIWTGSVAFGPVNVPVGLYAATEDAAVHFNQFQEGTSDRIRYKRVNERTGREVDQAHIVRGEEIVTEGGPPEDANVVDLMDALRRSAGEMRGRRGMSTRGSSRARAAKGSSKTGKSRAGTKAAGKPRTATRSRRQAG